MCSLKRMARNKFFFESTGEGRGRCGAGAAAGERDSGRSSQRLMLRINEKYAFAIGCLICYCDNLKEEQ